MPFKSQAQRKYLFANEPKVAKEFAAKTRNIAQLPNYVKQQIPSAKNYTKAVSARYGRGK